MNQDYKLKYQITSSGYYLFPILMFFIVLLLPLKTVLIQDKVFLYRFIKIVILSGFIFIITLRLFILKNLKFYIDEKLILVYFIIAVISNFIINRQYNPHSIGNPIEVILLYLGLSSFFIIRDDSDNKEITQVFKVFSFIPLIHFMGGLLIIKSKVLFNTPFLGLTWNPNFFGLLSFTGAVSALITSIFQEKNSQRTGSIIYLIIFSFNVLATFLSGSRGAILALLIFTIFVIIYSIKKRQFKMKYILMIVLFIFIITTTLFITKIYLFSLLKFYKGISARLRLHFWIDYFIDLYKNFDIVTFLFGKGFSATINNHYPKYSMHNIFLSVLGRYGVINLAIITYIFYRRTVQSLVSGNYYFSFAIISFIISSLFDSQIMIDNLNVPVFFFFMILVKTRNSEQAIDINKPDKEDI